LLNDDALLNIFELYPLDILESYHDVIFHPNWNTARWWYKLAQVCRRWRYLILLSPVRLGLHLVCTYDTPVADMLEHSPPLPIIVNYLDEDRETTAGDEEAILLALQYHDRVRRIGLRMPVTNLLKPIMAMDEQFPVLEHLFIWPPSEGDMTLMLPTKFQAPVLRQLSLTYVSLPMGSPLLTVATGLTYLELWNMPPAAFFPPSYLATRLSSMTQLESLSIGFTSPISTHDVESRPLHIPVPLITLPNLRLYFFRGTGAYLDGFLTQIRTPLLQALQLQLFNQLTFTIPHLIQFLSAADNVRFNSVRLIFFQEEVMLSASRREGDRVEPFIVVIRCRHIDWQVSAAAQIFNLLVPVLSVVEVLVLGYEEHHLSLELDDEVDRAQWRELLRPLNSVRTLHVAGGLIKDLARSLQSENEEPPLELLPELDGLVYYKEGDPTDAFTSFINTRQIAGRSVTAFHSPPSPSSWL